MFVMCALGVSDVVEATLTIMPVRPFAIVQYPAIPRGGHSTYRVGLPWEARKQAKEAPAGPVPMISVSMLIVAALSEFGCWRVVPLMVGMLV